MKRRTFVGIALLALSHLSFVNASSALTQAGSTGGSVGKQDKSISGVEAAPEPSPSERPRSSSRARPARASEADTSGCHVAGEWVWSTGGNAVINRGGTLTKGSLNAKWSCKVNHVVITWSHGFIDHLTLSPDATSLHGTNNLGYRINANRKASD
jgi:hypothetical protein